MVHSTEQNVFWTESHAKIADYSKCPRKFHRKIPDADEYKTWSNRNL
jgi:hypothetical protein